MAEQIKIFPLPYVSDRYGRVTTQNEQIHVLDIRGWGYLTGRGHFALALDDKTAFAIQAAIQKAEAGK